MCFGTTNVAIYLALDVGFAPGQTPAFLFLEAVSVLRAIIAEATGTFPHATRDAPAKIFFIISKN